MFKYTNTNKRYHSLDFYYKNKFGTKVAKISLNGGFSCPNKDGTKGVGGCIYCSKSGSGEFGGDPLLSLEKQFEIAKERMIKKWPTNKFIAYFQANTNTYDSVENLKARYEKVLNFEGVVGLAIATRADALEDDVLDYLSDLNKRTYLSVELGLQTSNDASAKFIGRAHDLKCFDQAVKKLQKRNIEVVAHIINGLPGETKKDMFATVKHLNNLKIDGIKIHMLNVLKNTSLENIYANDKFHILSLDEYSDIVIDQLRILDEKIVVHRLCSDPDPKDLIAPSWTVKKFKVMNTIVKKMKERNLFQGDSL